MNSCAGAKTKAAREEVLRTAKSPMCDDEDNLRQLAQLALKLGVPSATWWLLLSPAREQKPPCSRRNLQLQRELRKLLEVLIIITHGVLRRTEDFLTNGLCLGPRVTVGKSVTRRAHQLTREDEDVR